VTVYRTIVHNKHLPLKAYKVSLGDLCGFCVAHSKREAGFLFFRKESDYTTSGVVSPTTFKRLSFRVEREPSLDHLIEGKTEACKVKLV
jgi:hypothetical protein